MSSVSAIIPKFKLYPLYPGGPVITQRSDGLNAYSSFYTQANNFVPSYGVNVPSSGNTIQAGDSFFRLRADQTIEKRTVNEARNFNTSLTVDGTVLGNLKVAPVPPVAPRTPELYRDLVQLLAISDLKFSELMAQPSFRIPNIGLGLKVTTDGNGNVDNIGIQPSMQKTFPRIGTNDPTYTMLNRAEITQRATLRSEVGVSPVVPQSPAQPGAKPASVVDALNAPINPLNINRLERSSGLFNLEPLNPNRLFETRDLREQALGNPVVERLLALQPQEQGLAVSGADAALDVEQARNLAATNARLDVQTSARFKENLVSIIRGVTENQQPSALQQARAMDGQIPLAPSLPAPTKSGMEFGAGLADSNPFMAANAGVADAMEKKSAGGYLPFNLGSGNPNGGFDGGAAAGGNLSRGSAFAGQPGQQQQQRRRPLAFFA